MTTLKKQYEEKIAPALMKKFNYSSPMQIPKLTKMFGKSVKSFKDGMDENEDSSVKTTTEQKASDEAEQ